MRFLKNVFLALVLLFVIVTSGVVSLAQDTTITFLTPPWGVPPDEEALNAFTEETGITVEIQSVQMQDLFSQVQIAAATGGAAADVIFLSEEAPSNIVATGNMLPLNDFIANDPDLDVEDIEKLDFWTLDSDVYGITAYLQLVMLDYNAARLAEAGFDAPPTTWDEFREQVVAIKEAGIAEHPIAFGAEDWPWYLMSLSMGDPMFDEDLNPVFADEGSQAREAMAMLLGFFEDELISPDMLAGSITQHSFFWSGGGVFHQAWQGSLRVANNPEASQHAPNVEYMVMPEVGNTWSFPAAIGISRNSQNADAAWEFVKWYVAEQNQRDIYNAFGLIPSRTSVQQSLVDEGEIQGFDVIQQQSQLVNELPRYTLWWGPFTESVTETILEAAQRGMSADDAVDALAEEWNDLKDEFQ